MNLIDRAIEIFKPQAAVARAAARHSLNQIRSYDGAMFGRRTQNWKANNASANVAIKGALPALRARSRDVSRNTWWGARIKSVVVAHSVGAAIMPKPNTGSKRLDRRAKAAWKKWAKAQNCDAEGQLNFDGLLALAAGCIVESGEVLGRMIPVTQTAADVVPLELQLLEPDHLDSARDRVMNASEIVDQGIAYNERGKRIGYWLLPVHPGARGVVMPHVSVRVDARDVLHAYRKDRIGQGRGVPWVAPVLLKGRDVADLEEAIVIKSRIEACLAVFVKTTNQAKTITAGMTETAPGQKPRRIETLSPGMIEYLDSSEEISAVTPSSTANFETVLRTTWLTLAAGAGITYDQLTGDLERANFSSLRAGKIEFRRMIEQFQWHTLVAMFLEPLWERWVEVAQDSGVLPRRKEGYPVEWIMPANEPIDPMKDMQADILAVRSGRMTWPQFVAAWGLDPDTQLDEIEAWFTEIDKRKITLDTDPRKALASTKGGAAPEAQTEANTNVSPGKK
jgi:lambda family phage portal protein